MSPRPRRGLAHAALLAALVAPFFAPLLDPREILATRDVVAFHLPLRAAAAEIARAGEGLARLFPPWDPFAHGGQPLASNPNYGAFYPPTWIGHLFPPGRALSLLALLHAAIAAAGAYRFARRLGGDPAAARVAALVFACGPTYLALLHSLTQAFSFAWFPWVLAFALARHAAEGRRQTARATAGLALSFAAFVLAGGEPALLVLLAAALAILLLSSPRRALARVLELAPGLLLGAAAAAIQLVPTAARFADSARAAGLPFAEATDWSLSANRLPELLFPAFHGDPSRPMSALYFGWGVVDRDFPFLLSLSVTLPLLLLGVAAPFARGGRWRLVWGGFLLVGLGLGFGRHMPLYRPLSELVPGLSAARYPEKFALLALVALIFSGALAWRRILDERERGPARGAELPLALAAVVAAVATTLALVLRARPAALEAFVAARSGWPLSVDELARARAFFELQSLGAVAVAAAAAALFATARFSRLPRRALEVGLLVLVASELWLHSRPLLQTLPKERLLAPPAALVAAGAPRGGRIFSTEPFQREANALIARHGDLALNWARVPVDRLNARAGNLFGLRYVLDRDFDLTLTAPGRRALALYESLRDRPPLAHRLLGAWGVDRLVIQRSPDEIVADLRAGAHDPAPVRIADNSFALPEVRFLASYSAFASAEEAAAAAVSAGLPLNVAEFVVAPAPADGAALGLARLLADDDRGSRRRIAYESDRPSLLVVATTYDRGWSAAEAGASLPVHETAAGYLALVVPPGRRTVALTYRDPWLPVGAATSAAALLALLLIAARAASAAPSAGPRAGGEGAAAS